MKDLQRVGPAEVEEIYGVPPDLVPVSQVVWASNILVVNASSKLQSLRDQVRGLWSVKNTTKAMRGQFATASVEPI